MSFETFKEWLEPYPMSLRQIEEEHTPSKEDREDRAREFPHDPLPNIPFSFIHGEWIKLKTQMEPGDELYRFNSPEEDWLNLIGRKGVALVRHGEIIDVIVTECN
jgi:hypothetical protein